MARNVMLAVALGIVGLSHTVIGAVEPDVSLKPAEDFSGVFGGRRVDIPFLIATEKPWRGRLGWSLAVGGRTIERREKAVTLDPRADLRVEIPLDVPAVKPGVVMPAVLSIAIHTPGRSVPLASLERKLWIFPESPTAGRSAWLDSLEVCLFDPSGNTRAVLEEMKVPFTETSNVDPLGKRERGIIVIGEGTSFADYRGLSKMMAEAAARGVGVLCLAPADGEIALPGTEGNELPRPKSFTLRRADVIRDLDRRLDATQWPGGVDVVAGRLALGSDRNRVVAKVTKTEAGWPWLEMRFPTRQGESPGHGKPTKYGKPAKYGRIVVCGFGVIEHIDAGPTPRFLLTCLIEFVSQKGVSHEMDE